MRALIVYEMNPEYIILFTVNEPTDEQRDLLQKSHGNYVNSGELNQEVEQFLISLSNDEVPWCSRIYSSGMAHEKNKTIPLSDWNMIVVCGFLC